MRPFLIFINFWILIFYNYIHLSYQILDVKWILIFCLALEFSCIHKEFLFILILKMYSALICFKIMMGFESFQSYQSIFYNLFLTFYSFSGSKISFLWLMQRNFEKILSGFFMRMSFYLNLIEFFFKLIIFLFE